MVNTRLNSEKITVDVHELKKLIEDAISEHTNKLLKEIESLKTEVVILRESNIQLLNLCDLTSVKSNKVNNNHLENLELNMSGASTSSTETIIQAPKDSSSVNSTKSKSARHEKKALYSSSTKKSTLRAYSKSRNQKECTIQGSSEEQNEIAVADRKLWIYVGKLHANTTPEKLSQFLNKKFPNNFFDVNPLRSGSTSTSFRVGADFSLKDKLYAEETWPKGVLVKRFKFFRGIQYNPPEQL